MRKHYMAVRKTAICIRSEAVRWRTVYRKKDSSLKKDDCLKKRHFCNKMFVQV